MPAELPASMCAPAAAISAEPICPERGSSGQREVEVRVTAETGRVDDVDGPVQILVDEDEIEHSSDAGIHDVGQQGETGAPHRAARELQHQVVVQRQVSISGHRNPFCRRGGRHGAPDLRTDGRATSAHAASSARRRETRRMRRPTVSPHRGEAARAVRRQDRCRVRLRYPKERLMAGTLVTGARQARRSADPPRDQRSRPRLAGHTIPIATLTRRARAQLGKGLRAEVPRASHSVWEPPPDRSDPVQMLNADAEGRIAELLPVRNGRMLSSAFAFFRGSAAVMAADLAATPRTGIEAQLCGDAHLSNFGGFASPDRELVFDLNDFDETVRRPLGMGRQAPGRESRDRRPGPRVRRARPPRRGASRVRGVPGGDAGLRADEHAGRVVLPADGGGHPATVGRPGRRQGGPQVRPAGAEGDDA